MAELVHYQTCGFLKLAEVGLLEDSGCLMSLVDVEVHVLARIWAMAKTLQWWWLSQGFPTRHLRSVTTSHLLGILNDYIPCSLGRVRSFYNYCYTLFSPSMMFLLICSMSNGATKSMCVSVTKHSRERGSASRPSHARGIRNLFTHKWPQQRTVHLDLPKMRFC